MVFGAGGAGGAGGVGGGATAAGACGAATGGGGVSTFTGSALGAGLGGSGFAGSGLGGSGVGSGLGGSGLGGSGLGGSGLGGSGFGGSGLGGFGFGGSGGGGSGLGGGVSSCTTTAGGSMSVRGCSSAPDSTSAIIARCSAIATASADGLMFDTARSRCDSAQPEHVLHVVQASGFVLQEASGA